MSRPSLPRWLPGAGAMAAGHRARGLAALVLCAVQVLLWAWRGTQLAPALTGGPPGMTVAAWASLIILAGAWLAGREPAAAGIPRGPWGHAWHLLTAARLSRIGLAGCGLYLGVALLAPALAPHDPNRIGDGIATHSLPPLARVYLVERRDGGIITANEIELAGDTVRLRRGRSWIQVMRSELAGVRPEDWHRTRRHLLGTDHLGRDLLSRLLVGSQVSLGVGLLSALLAVALGAIIGGAAGGGGRRLDGLLMRFTDGMLAFPRLFLILLVLTVLPGSFTAVVVVLAATGWMGPCRLVRAHILALRQQEFVAAARAVGRAPGGVIVRHLLPNALAPLLVAATLRVGDTMLVEAGLSYLGLGVPPPHATWGNLVSGGRPALVEAWWVATFPGLAIVGAVIAFHLAGDGLRQALSRRQET